MEVQPVVINCSKHLLACKAHKNFIAFHTTIFIKDPVITSFTTTQQQPTMEHLHPEMQERISGEFTSFEESGVLFSPPFPVNFRDFEFFNYTTNTDQNNHQTNQAMASYLSQPYIEPFDCLPLSNTGETTLETLPKPFLGFNLEEICNPLVQAGDGQSPWSFGDDSCISTLGEQATQQQASQGGILVFSPPGQDHSEWGSIFSTPLNSAELDGSLNTATRNFSTPSSTSPPKSLSGPPLPPRLHQSK